jgi:hypothetical protein
VTFALAEYCAEIKLAIRRPTTILIFHKDLQGFRRQLDTAFWRWRFLPGTRPMTFEFDCHYLDAIFRRCASSVLGIHNLGGYASTVALQQVVPDWVARITRSPGAGAAVPGTADFRADSKSPRQGIRLKAAPTISKPLKRAARLTPGG